MTTEQLQQLALSGLTNRQIAASLGRKCVCMEREERYCEIAAKRLSQEYFDLGGI